MNQTNPFKSFWMAGYECTDKLNAFGNRVDFLQITGHIQLVDEDYKSLHPFKLTTVREGIRWSQIETKPYEYDWTVVKHMIERGKANKIQQVWDICHFGFPDDLTPLHPMFARRFAALCTAFVRFYRSIEPNETLIVTPINEVSFLSWLGGDAQGTSPYCTNQGWEVKYKLMQAYIEGSRALLEEDPTIRILTTEPLVNIVPPLNATPEQIAKAAVMHDQQFQSVDMLCGRICPELGGSPELLDIMGFNFYYNNQWVLGFNGFLPWLNEFPDERWVPLRNLLSDAYTRYNRPIVLSETSHAGKDRTLWIELMGVQCAAVIKKGIPLWGVCIYPIIDRPDWDHLHLEWHHSGLWDMKLNLGQPPFRILNTDYAESLMLAQETVNKEIRKLAKEDKKLLNNSPELKDIHEVQIQLNSIFQ